MISEREIGLQIVRPTGKRVGGAFTATTSRKTLPQVSATGMVEISATENCYLNFGGSSVDATAVIGDDASRLFLAGSQVFAVPLDPVTDVPYTHCAIISAGTDGVWQAEEAQ